MLEQNSAAVDDCRVVQLVKPTADVLHHRFFRSVHVASQFLGVTEFSDDGRKIVDARKQDFCFFVFLGVVLLFDVADDGRLFCEKCEAVDSVRFADVNRKLSFEWRSGANAIVALIFLTLRGQLQNLELCRRE